MDKEEEVERLLEERQHQVRRRGNRYKWQELKTYMHDPVKGEVLGRDSENWVKVILFYGLFYFGLFIYLCFFLALFLLRVDEINPAVRSMDSPLQLNPGMTMRPVPDFESTLIRFEQGKPHSYKPFTDHIQAHLWDYENEKQVGENFIDCTFGRGEASDQKVCRFDVNTLGDNCTWQKDYGYDEGQPCILVKLNRIYGWEPMPYTEEDVIPEEIVGRWHPDYIGISCEGKYASDKENIGTINYEPPMGFPIFYYPFLVQEGYRSPLVMVKFNNPTNGVLINVVCKLWAKNIKHHYNDNAGLIKFELLVD